MAAEQDNYEATLNHVNTFSQPSELKIVDMRFAELEDAPFPSIMMKLYTNQGIVGLGEVRDMGSRVSALILKATLLGENPCHIDSILRKIHKFGGQGRLGGGVSAVEIALWDLAGKAFGVPIYAMLGGRHRESVPIYCDTDVEWHPERTEGLAMGHALKERLKSGYTLLKMDLGADQLRKVPDALSAPLGYFEEYDRLRDISSKKFPLLWESGNGHKEARRKMAQVKEVNELITYLDARRNLTDYGMANPFPGIQITKKGFDYLENYLADVRSVIGYEVPLAMDHHGSIGVDQMIQFAHRLEKYNIAWLEDPIDTRYAGQFRRLREATTIPVCTGENIYLAENFKPLLEAGGIGVAHPDPLTLGGIWETKKLGDLAEKYGVRMAIHQCGSPIHAMAAAHAGVATRNVWGCEYHAHDIPWWCDLYTGDTLPRPLVQNGFITPPEAPGLGIEDLNDEVIAEHVSVENPGIWEPTDEWNHYYNGLF